MLRSVGTQSCADNCGATWSTEAHTVGLLMSYAHVYLCTFWMEGNFPLFSRDVEMDGTSCDLRKPPGRLVGTSGGEWVKPCRGRTGCVVPASVVLQGPHSRLVLGFATGVVLAEWRTWSGAIPLLLCVLVGKWVSTRCHCSVKIHKVTEGNTLSLLDSFSSGRVATLRRSSTSHNGGWVGGASISKLVKLPQSHYNINMSRILYKYTVHHRNCPWRGMHSC